MIYVDKLVARHYKKQKLSKTKVDNLRQKLARVERSDDSEQLPRKNSSVIDSGRFKSGEFRWYHYAAASMLLIVGVALTHTYLIDIERSEMALHAAALYHKTKLQLDVEAQSIAELRTRMKDLPFELTVPDSAQLHDFKLVGGRYCSINGRLAVHLRFVDDSASRQFSLFQTSLVPKLERLNLANTEIEGLSVRLWRDEQNFYIQAGG